MIESVIVACIVMGSAVGLVWYMYKSAKGESKCGHCCGSCSKNSVKDKACGH